MQLPEFPEANHPIVRSRLDSSDQELVQGFQQYPAQGQYFTAIFCRYGGLSYTVLRNMAPSSLQIDYLFAQLWRNIFYELRYFGSQTMGQEDQALTLQNWISDQTAATIHGSDLPQIETIQYSMQSASPPFWCYLHQALEQIPPLHRLILVLSQTHHWHNDRIVRVLQAEGEVIEPAQIALKLLDAQCSLLNALPADIREIYLGEEREPTPPSPHTPDQPALHHQT